MTAAAILTIVTLVLQNAPSEIALMQVLIGIAILLINDAGRCATAEEESRVRQALANRGVYDARFDGVFAKD